jgi:hypothetical protein
MAPMSARPRLSFAASAAASNGSRCKRMVTEPGTLLRLSFARR